MVSSTMTATYEQSYACASVPSMDCREMDAARALLGVSPSIAPVSVRSEPLVDSSLTLGAPALASEGKEAQPEKRSMQQESSSLLSLERLCGLPAQSRTSLEQVPEEYPLRPAARNLDALAALASTEQAKINSPSPFLVQSCGFSSSSDDDSETMPPPPPRGRRRSASNPEGMDKWDSLNRNRSARQHFVLPASILEEELAEVSEAVRERAERKYSEEYYDVSPDSVTDAEQATRAEKDDSNLTPDELLRRARSRLLEDLSEGTMNGEKGELVLPHNLSKYKEVYNQNGRIGIYLPSERHAIIARYNGKRSRRVWNKKIRYNCRKSLADRRLRVKGRFVKRSEQEQLAKQLEAEADLTLTGIEDGLPDESSVPGTPDEDMPDVNDPEAGFSPTEDMPYRRLRRHTIT